LNNSACDPVRSKIKIVVGFSVNQKPVGFNMTIPVLFPVADQGMIFMPRIHCFAGEQQLDDILQVVDILVL